MQPKSLPLAISAVIFMFIGTGLIGLGIGLPTWTESTFPQSQREEIGLFQECKEGESCEERDDRSDELKVVMVLCFVSAGAGLAAFLMGLFLICRSTKKSVTSCLGSVPWMTIALALVSGGAAVAALIIFEENEYDDEDTYLRLGVSFVLVATGGGFVVIGGLLFMCGGSRLISYLKRFEAKEQI